MSGALFDPLYGGLQRVLDLRMEQHGLTATNLANANTPGFKARVLDFESALSTAVGEGTGLELERSDPLHMTAAGASGAPVLELEAPPWAMDGNSVVPEREAARMTTNSLMYEAVSRGLGHRLAILRFAASDGNG